MEMRGSKFSTPQKYRANPYGSEVHVLAWEREQKFY